MREWMLEPDDDYVPTVGEILGHMQWNGDDYYYDEEAEYEFT